MQTQITRKKIVLKSPTKLTPEGGEEAPPAPSTLLPPPGVTVRRESFTWAAVCAIIACVCFMVLLALQAVEYSDLSTAFPMKPGSTAAP
ncbi:MAG: hypothetical protein FJ224_12940 [Lentisphaerae bacterium]|nr:hypothetical protein [Lentisphaerota bacterium]